VLGLGVDVPCYNAERKRCGNDRCSNGAENPCSGTDERKDRSNFHIGKYRNRLCKEVSWPKLCFDTMSNRREAKAADPPWQTRRALLNHDAA